MRARGLSILLFVTRAALGGDVSVTMTADRTQASLDDQIELQVSVQGTRQGGEPELLNAEAFEVQPGGSSSQIQIVNGKVSQNLNFAFVLTPKQPGKFRIGPARVNVGGKSFDSDRIEVTVVKSTANTAGSERLFYVSGEVDNNTPFVGEQVSYTFKFFNRAQLANAQLGLPEFKGFLKEGPDRQKEAEQVVNGVKWHVTELRFALFPMSAGALTIEPVRLAADAILRQRGDPLFDDLFGGGRTRRVTLRSEPVTLTVSPLPSASRPASFTGLVGRFTLSEELGKQALAVGDSSTLTMVLEGDGNLRDFALPLLTSGDFKIYDDQPTFLLTPGPRWKGTKTFKRALVPLKPGALPIPSVELGYFDTQSKSYKVLESRKQVITASGGAGEEGLNHVAATPGGGARKQIEVLGKDLMPIKRTPAALRSDDLRPRERWLLLLACLVCPGIYAGLLFLKRSRDRLSADSGLARRRSAYREFSSRLQGIDANGANGAFFEAAAGLLREYLGNKFNLDGKAITPIDARRKLASHPLSADSIGRIEAFLRECETGQYGGEISSEEGKANQRRVLVSIVSAVEKEARG